MCVCVCVCQFGWGTNSPTATLQRGKEKHPKECPVNTKQSDADVPVMLELGECGAPLHCHRSKVHSGLEW